MDISATALVNSSTQMQQCQVAQTVQVLVLKKAMDIQATRTLALLHAPPLNGWQRDESVTSVRNRVAQFDNF